MVWSFNIQDLKKSFLPGDDGGLGVMSRSGAGSRLTRFRGVNSCFTRSSSFRSLCSTSHGKVLGMAPYLAIRELVRFDFLKDEDGLGKF